MREQGLVGLDSLHAVTALLQRIRNAQPTAGLYQAAELQWWRRDPRSTDELPQLFWFDGQGRPAAAVIATDFGDGSSAVFEPTRRRGAGRGARGSCRSPGMDHVPPSPAAASTGPVPGRGCRRRRRP